jgi:hypothetical protein
MLTILSALDERARPKGSRDPLGIEAIWSHTGRQLVGNLTTVTANLENFIVALLCCHHASGGAADLEEVQQQFMRAEQLAAYLKLSNGLEGLQGFLGITKARKNFQKPKVPLGGSANAQILSDQLSYGLWGLYSTALEGAGLIFGARRELTDAGSALVGILINALGEGNWVLFRNMASQTGIEKTALNALAVPFARLLQSASVRHTVVEALLGQKTGCSLQLELYALAKAYLEDQGVNDVQRFCAWILSRDAASPDLRDAVRRLGDLEPLLVIAETVMGWLQFERNESEGILHQKLAPCLAHVRCADAWIRDTGMPHRTFLEELLGAVNVQAPDRIIDTIVRQNKHVMQQRGGAAWIEFDQQRQLTVRVRNDRAGLPADMAAHVEQWHNSYFLGSFLSITRQGMA